MPAVVETRVEVRVLVKPDVVERRERDEIYPAVPKPVTVEAIVVPSPRPTTVEVTVEASSFGSINELTNVSRPLVVDCNVSKLIALPPLIDEALTWKELTVKPVRRFVSTWNVLKATV
jgi:hypothetical protein